MPGSILTIQGKSVTVARDGQFSANSHVSDSSLTISLLAISEVGLTSSKTVLFTPVQPPQVDPVHPTDTMITGHAENGVFITVKAGSKVIGTAAIPAGSTAFSVPLPSMQEGSNLGITATDVYGNQSNATFIVVK